MAENEAKMERMEAELGHAKVAEEAEMRKAKRWREELAAERDRLRDLLARLRSVCLMAIRSSGTDEAGRFCLEPTCSLDDDVQLIAIIDDLLMKALCSARREADALRIQQQKQIRELDDLKRDILGLRRTGNELNANDDKLLMENKNIKKQVDTIIIIKWGKMKLKASDQTLAEKQAEKRRLMKSPKVSTHNYKKMMLF
jgi:hypothetical protein